MRAPSNAVALMEPELFDSWVEKQLNPTEPKTGQVKNEQMPDFPLEGSQYFPSVGKSYSEGTPLLPNASLAKETLGKAKDFALNLASSNPLFVFNTIRSPAYILTSALYSLFYPEQGLVYSEQGRAVLKNSVRSLAATAVGFATRMRNVYEGRKIAKKIESESGYLFKKSAGETVVYKKGSDAPVFRLANTAGGLTLVTDKRSETAEALKSLSDTWLKLRKEEKVPRLSFLNLVAEAEGSLKKGKYLTYAEYQNRQTQYRNHLKRELLQAVMNPNVSADDLRGEVAAKTLMDKEAFSGIYEELRGYLRENGLRESEEKLKKAEKRQLDWRLVVLGGAVFTAVAAFVYNYSNALQKAQEEERIAYSDDDRDKLLNRYNITLKADDPKTKALIEKDAVYRKNSDGTLTFYGELSLETDPSKPNPNVAYALRKGLLEDLAKKLKPLDADGKMDFNEQELTDYLVNTNLVKLSPEQVTAIRAQCVQEVLKDSMVSDKEAVGLHTLSLYPGETQTRYANFSENVFEYFSTLASLLAKDSSKKDLVDYYVLNKVRMEGDGLPGFRLTDLDMKFLLEPEKYAKNVFDADLKKLEPARPDLPPEIRKIPDYEKIGIKEAETNEDVVNRVLRSNKDELKVYDVMLKEGIPAKRKFCSPLQTLVWYCEDNELVGRDPITVMASSDESIIKSRMYDFIDSVWKKTYGTPRWKDFWTVVYRLNSPELVALYMKNNIRYIEDPSGGWFKTAFETFRDGGGDCEDHGMFGALSLATNGYEAYVFGVFPYLDRGTGGHAVTLFKHPNTQLFYLFDNTMFSGIKGIFGPYDSINEVVSHVYIEPIGAEWKRYIIWDINWNIIKQVIR